MNRDKKKNVRLDHQIICDIIEPGTSVLDLGCGNGDLLALLRQEKHVKGQGIELKESAIFECVEKGISVFHMDFDSGLSSYPDKSFDYVILNQSLQETLHVEFVLQEALRVGKKVVVGFPNFAHLRARIQLFFRGRTPVTNALPYLWYNTPNLHFLSISDFERFMAERKIKVIERYYYCGSSVVRFLPNLFAMNAIYVINGALRA
ncbi:MAG: methionine biosynthesis protein MetW [Candidatus Aminicenantes bacterium]|nr:methionine biosynthesis protein MetW [Candidatus Aminicenantes bacterium]NIM80872.1 methionine biosynthesis protein MetW [Candidatus Aminicenantes bacterium]NIN20256.1 methionine biosynthesis protein MetW [Candidatus Aminicenantes bacterium]NIN44035.1 methionine biosynthesis protein MetW [Candidatus Aminicenantes bacterium]NIN86845.1 methionine biosynthesis protein MetW [Candidatus Aminicenantes bacterium]